MKIDIAKDVYEDALQGEYSAPVGVFLTQWVPFMFRKIKRQEQEIETLKELLSYQRGPA